MTMKPPWLFLPDRTVGAGNPHDIRRHPVRRLCGLQYPVPRDSTRFPRTACGIDFRLETRTTRAFGIGFAAINVHTGAAGDLALALCSDGTCGTTGSSFSGTLRTRAASGEANNTLNLQVQASVVGSGVIAEQAGATADPMIFIDPTFPNANLYSIVVSPGVANAAAVPEPAGAELVTVGTLLLAASRRFKRR
jgi:hypothetical protein